jgi:phosphoribosyl-ATP pyrophosphohydrolase/phosphoribosyl-AMP cyclohydrolase
MLSFNLDALDFAKSGGTVTVVVQDARSGAVLMVAHADREALEQTIATGEMHFRSRSRGLWHKGATSGNTQRVVSLAADCDGDAILARVHPAGPACHTGATSCFGSTATAADPLHLLDRVIAERAASLRSQSEPTEGASRSYTQRLLGDRNLRLKKLGEETAEMVLACADEDRTRSVEEAADLLYHTLVALHALGANLDDVADALDRRRT